MEKALEGLQLAIFIINNKHEQLFVDFMSGSNFPPLQSIVSREKKFQILDKAIERHDGNAITRIIIWLKESLKRDPDLMKDLMMRPAAMNHYICYLKEMKEFDELHELLCRVYLLLRNFLFICTDSQIQCQLFNY